MPPDDEILELMEKTGVREAERRSKNRGAGCGEREAGRQRRDSSLHSE